MPFRQIDWSSLWKKLIDEVIPVILAMGVLVLAFLLARNMLVGQARLPTYSLRGEYDRAVHASVQSDPSFITQTLDRVDENKPVTVVTWMNHEKVPDYKPHQKSDTDRTLVNVSPTYKVTWVALASSLKKFCQDYVRSHGDDRRMLYLRLKQHLGLPPDSRNDTLVELTIDPKASGLFRPCFGASLDSTTCPVPSPPKPEQVDWKGGNSPGNPSEVEWFLRNYYSSFGSPYQYPWTALGYTFDWARKDESHEDLVRWGESEFVIPPGKPIQFDTETETMAYCTPK
jgi:hypothetical protein